MQVAALTALQMPQAPAQVAFCRSWGMPGQYTMPGKAVSFWGMAGLDIADTHANVQARQHLHPCALAEAEQALETGLPYTLRIPFLGPKGVGWLEEIGCCKENFTGPQTLVYGVLRWVPSSFAKQGPLAIAAALGADFYEKTLTEMPQDLVVLDTSQRYLFVNENSIKDPERRAWLIGKKDIDYYRVYGRSLQPALYRQVQFAKCLETKTPIEWQEESTLPGGSVCYSRKTYAPVLCAEGQVKYVLGYGFNITDLYLAQAAVLQKNAELEKAYAELDKFVYSASHDLRAPLTSILGIIKVIEAEKEVLLPDDAILYSQMIKTSVKRLDDYVVDLIDYYRNNRSEVLKEEVDIALLIQDIYLMLEYARPEYRLRLEYDGPQSLFIKADAGRLRVIVTNLISNAIKYHNKHIGFVRTTLLHHNNILLVQVQDNGPGIAAKHLPRLFEMFYRPGNKMTGSGLGLYIAREAATKLGGTLTVASSQGGSVFALEIPAAQS